MGSVNQRVSSIDVWIAIALGFDAWKGLQKCDLGLTARQNGPRPRKTLEVRIACQTQVTDNNRKMWVSDLSSRQEPSVTTGRSLFSPLPPAFAVVPQYLFRIPVESPAPLGTGQAAFPYIRLFGRSFSKPPLYDTGSGLCGAWV